ncbi:9614_t:CDS:2 [Cetraspora pellucida]|uniref:9614_t:CDS:1 n=1 Tax=Cetraspora pellucida TaxID=1433469 RepID=A0A9N9I000_9GLOM|nr:9614_t:CDS:2 [Cetraspora pellucida]
MNHKIILLVTYDKKSQTANIKELLCLDEISEVEENSDDENIENLGPLYLITPEIVFSNWKKVDE